MEALTIKVTPNNGVRPLEVIKDMKWLAIHLGVCCETSLNGVYVAVTAESSVFATHEAWANKVSDVKRG